MTNAITARDQAYPVPPSSTTFTHVISEREVWAETRGWCVTSKRQAVT